VILVGDFGGRLVVRVHYFRPASNEKELAIREALYVEIRDWFEAGLKQVSSRFEAGLKQV
jgi:hypothetical protein